MRLLIACYEPPGFGGASTIAYHLHSRLLEQGHDSHLLLFLDKPHLDFYRLLLGENYANPSGLRGVRVCQRWPLAAVKACLEEISPTACVGVGWLATYYVAQAYPHRPCILYATGLDQAAFWVPGIEDLTNETYAGFRLPTYGPEPLAFDRCEYVVACSPMIRELILKLWPQWAGKLAPRRCGWPLYASRKACPTGA